MLIIRMLSSFNDCRLVGLSDLQKYYVDQCRNNVEQSPVKGNEVESCPVVIGKVEHEKQEE